MTSHHKNEGNYHSTSRWGNEAPKLHRVTQQSSLLAAEVFASEPCWTTHWIPQCHAASNTGCCHQGHGCQCIRGSTFNDRTIRNDMERLGNTIGNTIGNTATANFRTLSGLRRQRQELHQFPAWIAAVLCGSLWARPWNAGRVFIKLGFEYWPCSVCCLSSRMRCDQRQPRKICFAWSWVIPLQMVKFHFFKSSLCALVGTQRRQVTAKLSVAA